MNDEIASAEVEPETRADEAEHSAYDSGQQNAVESDASDLSVYEQEFRDKVAGWGLKHFSYKEFLFLGGSNNSPGSACFGLNSLPPKDRWDNFEKTAKVLDELRERLRAPIRLSSIFRAEDYNGCLSGAAAESQHKMMRAADFSCGDGNGPTHWHREVIKLRNEGFFKGGVGLYNTFVHVDTRGVNKDW